MTLKEEWERLDQLVMEIYGICEHVPNIEGHIAEIQECVDSLKGKLEEARNDTGGSKKPS